MIDTTSVIICRLTDSERASEHAQYLRDSAAAAAEQSDYEARWAAAETGGTWRPHPLTLSERRRERDRVAEIGRDWSAEHAAIAADCERCRALFQIASL